LCGTGRARTSFPRESYRNLGNIRSIIPPLRRIVASHYRILQRKNPANWRGFDLSGPGGENRPEISNHQAEIFASSSVGSRST
jgi:hypothetical protein